MLKAVILVGGPQKGTSTVYRLWHQVPAPLLGHSEAPVPRGRTAHNPAPHNIEACVSIEDLKEILIIGFYPAAQIQPFVNDMQHQYNIMIRYLQEFTSLGTAGGLYHFRDQIRYGNPDAFLIVLNGDVCADFPLAQLYEFHKLQNALVTMTGTEATRQQSLNYGCIVSGKSTNEVTHYVEKPSSYVSTLINCGIYVFVGENLIVYLSVYNAGVHIF